MRLPNSTACDVFELTNPLLAFQLWQFKDSSGDTSALCCLKNIAYDIALHI
eukprot:c34933_g1_i1 orf=1-150(-)